MRKYSIWQWTAICGLVFSPVQLTAGEIAVREPKLAFVDRVTFSVDRTGVIAKVPKEGEQLEAGQTVVQLKDEVPRAMLAVAEAKAQNDAPIEVASKTAEYARLDYEASLEANRKAGSSVAAYPPTHIARLKLNMEASDLKVKEAETEFEINRLSRDQAIAEMESFRIVTGINGVVTQVFKHPGEGVQQGEAIVQIVNPDKLRVEGFVNAQDAYLLKPGMPVQVSVTIPEQNNTTRELPIEGKLGFIDVTVQPLSNRVRVWAEIDNSEHRLREGLPVSMKIANEPAAPAPAPTESTDKK
ncbi:efflux RND transporter periplasmic adaptor subunit [Planctomicrobium piriforme]|uniref:HlyD family secretion protein n=1 Tax=Planctomicrobium piriforme TaxID=1576369 RepID=A0A1I3G5U8_9PLAN|nr:HlyD family efflux transporter periplasmic adaptor subunit [Planctomicrobium piriforme]SFI18632.1 HlyD family secretion protein [Planctomicrobium piriforme]